MQHFADTELVFPHLPTLNIHLLMASFSYAPSHKFFHHLFLHSWLIKSNYGQENPKNNHGTLNTQDKTQLIPCHRNTQSTKISYGYPLLWSAAASSLRSAVTPTQCYKLLELCATVICCSFFLEANHLSMLTTVLSHQIMHGGGSKQKCKHSEK